DTLLEPGQEFDPSIVTSARREWMILQLEEVGQDTEGKSNEELAEMMRDHVYVNALDELQTSICPSDIDMYSVRGSGDGNPLVLSRENFRLCSDLANARSDLSRYSLEELSNLALRAQRLNSDVDDESNLFGILLQYYSVADEAQLNAILANWDKEAEREQLNQLLNLISAMPSSILGTSVSWVIQAVSEYYGHMEARWQVLSEIVRPQEEAALAQAEQEADARDLYTRTLFHANTEGLIDTTPADWAGMSTSQLRVLAYDASILLGTDLEFIVAYHDITDIDTWKNARQISAASLLVLSFVPIVGTAVDIVEGIAAYRRGDAFGMFLSTIGPLGDAARAIRALRAVGDTADEVLRGADETVSSLVREHGDAVAKLDDGVLEQMDEVAYEIDELADEIDELANRPSGMSSNPSNNRVSDQEINELRSNIQDINSVLKNLNQRGFDNLTEADVRSTKRYMFDNLMLDNNDRLKYEAWQRIIRGNPTSLDMALFMHELEEFRALKRFVDDQQTLLPDSSIDISSFLLRSDELRALNISRVELEKYWRIFYFGMDNISGNSRTTLRGWNPGHSQALMAEFQYIANQIYLWTGVNLDTHVVAASSVFSRLSVDPSNIVTRGDEAHLRLYVRSERLSDDDLSAFVKLSNHPSYRNWRYNEKLTLNNNIPEGFGLIPGQEVMIHEIIEAFFTHRLN
ncbi:MAG: hypothetical protein AAFV93_12030, partial [Chloroflexota bacterium]